MFDILEWGLRDRFFRLRSPEPIDRRVVIISVDSTISDADLAKLITQLKTYSPSAIGLALYQQPSEDYGSDDLSELLATYPKLIGVEKVLRNKIDPPPELVGSDRLAISNLVLDRDLTVRRALLSLIDPQDNALKHSLGTQLARLHLEQQDLTLKTLDAETQTFRWGNAVFSPMRRGQGGYPEGDLGGYQILLNWRGPAASFAAVSLSDVFTRKVDPSLIAGHMVLIGPDASIESPVQTPFGFDNTVPNFVVQANIASQITSAVLDGRKLLTSWRALWQWLWILVWAGVSTGSTWQLCQQIERSVARYEVAGTRNWVVNTSQKVSLPLLACLLLSGSLMVLGYGAFLSGVVVPVVTPIVAIAIGTSATTNSHKKYRLSLVNKQLAFANQELFDYSRTLQERVSDRTKALEKAKITADAANQAKSDFLANMSHELRTPLNGILGYAQLLSRSDAIPDKQKEGLAVIKQCGNHLLALINDILDIAKIEARKLELHPCEIHLPKFLESVCEICRIKAEEKGLSFRLEVAESLPTGVCVDEKRLRQVLLNLLGNAIKFTQQGHVTLRVEALMPASEEASALLNFQVEDSGIGITPDQMRQIFLPFEQVGETIRKKEGTGLGLSISQQIVQLMNGEIQLKSIPGHGSLFWFDIELSTGLSTGLSTEHAFAADDAAYYQTDASVRWSDISVQRKPIIEIEGYTKGKGPTILIVDERLSDRTLLKDMLRPAGFQVIENDGTSGIDILQRETPDLLIVDMSRQSSNSYRFTEAIRQQPAFQTLPILATGAQVVAADRQRYLAAGASDLLPKPIQLEHLLDAIAAQLHLTWRYTLNPAAPPSVALSPIALAKSPPAADRLPPELLSRLYHLAMMGNLEAIRSELETLEIETSELQTFAENLQLLVDSFQVKKIKAYLTAHMAT